ncbi:hypothetical protein [Bythopirellula polymerisocia]|uniref:Uncharacterized protein n=1 Tax=Bythopirellula polymerisocia TaxID=2528003 RepID=A0A5C6CZ37_9BACT|nr:hypothetical protein [Bythopirellula polymerisocia]TWU29892.1 hypothetical protein Pla144_06720 [Bythopirellula polymerisocia]
MTFASQNEPCSSHYSPRYRLGWLGCVVLACSGCWEEIHYIPSKSPIAQSAETESEAAAEQDHPTVPAPTSDELFGDNSEPETLSEEPRESLQDAIDTESVPSAETPLDEPQLAESHPEQPTDEPASDLFGEEEASTSADPVDKLDSEESEPTELEWGEVLRPSRTALAAWKMCSHWSYAAAIYAKGLGVEQYGDSLQHANNAAEILEMELPEFPHSEKDDLQAAVIDYLIHAGRMQLADQLADTRSPEYAALAELAIKSHVLLLVYTPKSQHLEPIVLAIRRAAEDSTLPPSLWEEFVKLLEQRAPYSAVKAAVLKLHQQVGDYLGGSLE